MNTNNNSLNNNFNINQIVENNFIKGRFSDLKNKSVSEILGKELFIIKKEDFNLNKILNDPMSMSQNNILNRQTIIMMEKSLKIISSKDEVGKLIKDNVEFVLVNKEFFDKKQIKQAEYNGKEVIFFESDNKQYLIFPKDNINILEIGNSKTPENLPDNKTNKVSEGNMNIGKFIETKEIILKKLILLYAFEKHFIQLINSPIKDEYDINEYYLINKNWINCYKTSFLYHQFIPLIDSMQLSFSYKGYCINIDEIFSQILMNNNNNNVFLNYFNNIETFYNNNSLNFCKEDNFQMCSTKK